MGYSVKLIMAPSAIPISPDSDIDKKWAAIARRRISELRSGEIKAVPGEEVFSRIWKRFSP